MATDKKRGIRQISCKVSRIMFDLVVGGTPTRICFVHIPLNMWGTIWEARSPDPAILNTRTHKKLEVGLKTMNQQASRPIRSAARIPTSQTRAVPHIPGTRTHKHPVGVDLKRLGTTFSSRFVVSSPVIIQLLSLCCRIDSVPCSLSVCPQSPEYPQYQHEWE